MIGKESDLLCLLFCCCDFQAAHSLPLYTIMFVRGDYRKVVQTALYCLTVILAIGLELLRNTVTLSDMGGSTLARTDKNPDCG